MNKISYFVLSDIHLGCKRNNASEMIKRLTVMFGDFKNETLLSSIDILFIAGDLFDGALWFTNEDVTHTLLFMRKLMWWCEKNKIKLRVLEGTPSHDRKQARNLLPISETFKELDFKYIETMCVEGFYDLGITCLYVPDEYGGSALQSQDLIQKELDSLGYDKVDIAIMHGMFKFQVPEIASDRFKYDERFFLDRVRYFINIGHIHVFSTFERIIAQGSADRISHKEERPKGGCLQILDPVIGNSFHFIENKLACIFKTVNIKTKDLNKSVLTTRKIAESLPAYSHIRIKASRDNSIFNVYDQLVSEFPFLFFSKITEEEEVEKNKLVTQQDILSIDYTPIHITKENIVQMIMSGVKSKNSFRGDYLDKLENKLMELSS